MLHELPITNVRLTACREDWARMTPSARGRHCQRCSREVVDFTQSTQAELLWARAGAADGRVCGRFRASQLAAVPAAGRLRARLRWFLAAVVLVLLQGFSAEQAVAQVRRPATAAPHRAVMGAPPPRARPRPAFHAVAVRPPGEAVVAPGNVQLSGELPAESEPTEGGPYPGLSTEMLMRHVQRHLRYPTTGRSTAQVLVRFTVDAAGQVQAPSIERSAGPAFDTEALRAVQQLPRLPPPPQPQEITLPIYFRP
ncbi:TonB family protein [Hymenobacter sp. 15J16-1T3B]|uniref:TonB family protein n=1 Tax=Hymenobacter sp. 15J16-1T3B TaxID=2886941 RepID=UPI001D11C7C3|nr:TonB family protein [Hymenobacter sp. 15J16-1T3B]MCC3156333.1 TonB family protein [Hymenobacter sp. 15J16-1T3B]